MNLFTCPRCLSTCETPQLFPYTVQRILDYIWRNPGVDREALIDRFYGTKNTNTKAVNVHITHIRRGLKTTNYRLVTQRVRSPRGGNPVQYFIKPLEPHDREEAGRPINNPKQGTANGTV